MKLIFLPIIKFPFAAFGRIWLPYWFKPLHPVRKEGILRHELEHLAQQRRVGVWCYLWRYFTQRDFRRKMELEAYGVEIAHLAAAWGGLNEVWIGYFAGEISRRGYPYFGMMSRLEAEEWVLKEVLNWKR